MKRASMSAALVAALIGCESAGYEGRVTFVRDEVSVRVFDDACDCEPRAWMPDQCNVWSDTSDPCLGGGPLDSVARRRAIAPAARRPCPGLLPRWPSKSA